MKSHELNQDSGNYNAGWEELTKLARGVQSDLEFTDQQLKDYELNNETYQDDVAAEEELHQYHNFAEARKNYPEYFADWQVECLEEIKNSHNVILSSPTGSGKTTVFMEWAKIKQEEAEREGKHNTTYITAPIKALSNQRFRELQEQGYKVGIETGDIKNVPEDADYICCTQEIFTNKYCDEEDATLIVDEFHYIFENSDRSRAYIDGIHDTKAKNVLLCSATFGDMDALDGYVEKATGRDFNAYENHERLTELFYGDRISSINIKDALVVAFSADKCEEVAYDLANIREEDELKVDKIKEICEKYNTNYEEQMAKGVCTYYGKKLPKEKLCIEELFENQLIDTVVGTDALALGVNFPVKNVVFTELAKFSEYREGWGPIGKVIPKNLFDQLAGRAGRKGYFNEGFVYYTDDWGHSAYDIDNDEAYDYLIEKQNEAVNIELTPKIKDILSGKTTIDEEVSYLSKFSTQEVDTEDIKMTIENEIDYINSYNVRNYISPKAIDINDILPTTSVGARRIDAGGGILINDEYAIGEGTFVDWKGGSTVEFYASNNDETVSFGYGIHYLNERENPDGIVGFFDSSEGHNIRSGAQKEDYVCSYDGENNVWRLKNPTEELTMQSLTEEQVASAEKRINDAWREIQQSNRDSGLRYKEELAYAEELQQEFDNNIKNTYNDQLSAYENCNLLGHILVGDDPIDLLTKENGHNLGGLLTTRQTLRALPRKYRKNIDFARLDKRINSIDETVLNAGRGALSVEQIKENVGERRVA